MPHTETIKNTQVNEFIKTDEKDNLLSVRRNILPQSDFFGCCLSFHLFAEFTPTLWNRTRQNEFAESGLAISIIRGTAFYAYLFVFLSYRMHMGRE